MAGALRQRIHALEVLHDRAVESARDGAQLLGRIKADQQRAEDKLTQLQEFTQQYRDRLCEMETRGGTWSELRDIRAFIARLDGAQAAQASEISRIAAQCERATLDWTEQRRREKAFELLLAQQHDMVRAQALRRESDELQEWNLNAAIDADRG